MERGRFDDVKHSLILIAVVLVVVWIVARLTLAIISVALHLLWIAAVIMAIIWLIRLVSGRR